MLKSNSLDIVDVTFNPVAVSLCFGFFWDLYRLICPHLIVSSTSPQEVRRALMHIFVVAKRRYNFCVHHVMSLGPKRLFP